MWCVGRSGTKLRRLSGLWRSRPAARGVSSGGSSRGSRQKGQARAGSSTIEAVLWACGGEGCSGSRRLVPLSPHPSALPAGLTVCPHTGHPPCSLGPALTDWRALARRVRWLHWQRQVRKPVGSVPPRLLPGTSCPSHLKAFKATPMVQVLKGPIWLTCKRSPTRHTRGKRPGYSTPFSPAVSLNLQSSVRPVSPQLRSSKRLLVISH